jgi:hypothetical protein
MTQAQAPQSEIVSRRVVTAVVWQARSRQQTTTFAVKFTLVEALSLGARP